jgi:uncharacterized protein YecA (UPF0149 family)
MISINGSLREFIKQTPSLIALLFITFWFLQAQFNTMESMKEINNRVLDVVSENTAAMSQVHEVLHTLNGH